MILNCSPTMWPDEPLPGEPNEILPGFCARVVDELFRRLRRHAGMHDQHVGRGADQDDRLEILGRIVGQLLQVLQDRLGRMEAHVDRVAVGRRLRDEVGGDHAAGAGALLGDDGHAGIVVGDPLRDRAREQVGDAAGRRRNDDADRLVRIILRRGGRGPQRNARDSARRQLRNSLDDSMAFPKEGSLTRRHHSPGSHPCAMRWMPAYRMVIQRATSAFVARCALAIKSARLPI